MKMKHLLLLLACSLRALAQDVNCSGLPTSFKGNEFPSGDFFVNFNNPCYTIPLGQGNGAGKWGDLNATYFQAYYKVDPRYQLILVGAFPNSRYFSVTLYDAHSATSQWILDQNIMPLTSAFINPYEPGRAFVDGQQFAVPINFGSVQGPTQAGCTMEGYNVSQNGLDGTRRHPGMDWNTDASLFQAFPNFVPHVVDTPQHTNPNTAGVVMVRAFMDITAPSYQSNPHLIVRDVASGCAYPAAYVTGTLQIVAGGATAGGPWLDGSQEHAHHLYETSYLPQECFGNPAPPNRLPWLRQPEFIPGGNPHASYIVATVPPGTPATLASAGEVMRIRFRVPVTPPTPCTNGCSRSGSEQMRYMSLSFQIPGGNTLASLADTAFTQDPNGYVTLIVGTGATIPSWVTPANNYTFLDLTAIPNYDQLGLLDVRHIIPAGGFNCAGQFVPYRTGANTILGSLMGDYTPVVDYPAADSLPSVASPLIQQSACGLYPLGSPGIRPACGVLPPLPPTISSVVTQCPTPGCAQFVAQPAPSVIITGSGFGEFPNGEPFIGTSDYLQILNVTQGWSAGYTGDSCNVSVHSWTDSQIQIVADINHKGRCPLSAGDQLTFKVWNPQSLLFWTLPVTAN